MDPCQNELALALARLYRSGKYSDLTIICNDSRYKVHKALLCSRSLFFDTACSSKFLEAQSGEINMSEEDEQVVQHMMNYFYYLDYDTNQKPGSAPRTAFRASPTKPKHLDMSHDPLLATASTLSPPASRAASPNDNRHHHPTTTTIESTLSHQPPRLRIPRALSRRQMDLRRSTRTRSRASNQDSPPPLTPSSLREAEPSDADEMELSDADSSGGGSSDSADDGGDNSSDAIPPLLTHARLYSAGEKYGIPGLKALSKRKFENLLFPTSENFAASPLGNAGAREAFLAEDFPAAIEEVYTGTVEGDRGLRNAVVQAFRMHPEWGWKEGVAEVIREHGALAWDLYRISSGMPVQR